MEYLHGLSDHLPEMQGTPHTEVEWQSGWIWVGSNPMGLKDWTFPKFDGCEHPSGGNG